MYHDTHISYVKRLSYNLEYKSRVKNIEWLKKKKKNETKERRKLDVLPEFAASSLECCGFYFSRSVSLTMGSVTISVTVFCT